MAIGTVTQKLRPLRLAFLVNPSDRGGVMDALRLSSTFWGGMFNPIVPCYGGRVPRAWSRLGKAGISSRELVEGYIDGFDPDVIVPVSPGSEEFISLTKRTTLTSEEILGGVLSTGATDAGVGAFEMVQGLFDKEFKYVRKDDLSLLIPSFDKRHEMFLLSVFGDWPNDLRSMIMKHFEGRLKIVNQKCSIDGFEALLAPSYLSPRRVGSFGIEYYPREACVYCMDATSSLDVIDFWNLRAAGYYVIPAPKQMFASESLKSWIASFVEGNYSHEPGAYHHTTFQIGRSLRDEDVAAFVKALNIESAGDGRLKCAMRSWYPRLWDKWARENTDERVISFYSQDAETSLDGDLNRIDLKVLSPEIPRWGRVSSLPKFVNEISYRIYGAKMPMAEVLPEGEAEPIGGFGYWRHRGVRVSRTGLSYSLSSYDRRISFEIPSAESLMLSWFKQKGWSVEMSSPGLIAAQMLRSLHGEGGLYTINSERLLKILDKHASEKKEHDGPDSPRAPRWIKESALHAEVRKIIIAEGLRFEPSRYISRLLEGNVLRLGLQLHCPTCQRWMWKAVESLSEEIDCEQCLSKFSLSAAPPREREWSYKPHGPFNVRGYGGGAYPVLLTWKYFSRAGMKRTTPLLSFNALKGDVRCEVDLAIFCEDESWRNSKSELILCECKAYDLLKSRDISRMEFLGKSFPGSTLVFSKFGGEFEDSEKCLLKSFVTRQRKLRLAGKPHCQVVLLTGLELFAYKDAPQCWDGKPEPYANWRHISTISELGDATQNIYLGMESFHEWGDPSHTRV
ncbi:hypothetical protein LL974_13545 [Xanthomonas campestris pv. cannae]|nr:hypothetical protein [Xanthomonas campestris pv. cannae]